MVWEHATVISALVIYLLTMNTGDKLPNIHIITQEMAIYAPLLKFYLSLLMHH